MGVLDAVRLLGVLVAAARRHGDYDGRVVLPLEVEPPEETATATPCLCLPLTLSPSEALNASSRVRRAGQRPIRVRGLFNSGTNFAFHVLHSTHLPVVSYNSAGWWDDESVFRWKHTPLAEIPGDALPRHELHVVIARHPLDWVQSSATLPYDLTSKCFGTELPSPNNHSGLTETLRARCGERVPLRRCFIISR